MSWSTILDSVATAIEATTSLVKATVVFDVESVGEGSIGKVFCFAPGMSGDLGVPGSGRVLDSHQLDVRMLYKLGDDWLADFKAMQDDSKAVRDALALRQVSGADIVVGSYDTEEVGEGSEYVIRTIPLQITQTNSIGG